MSSDPIIHPVDKPSNAQIIAVWDAYVGDDISSDDWRLSQLVCDYFHNIIEPDDVSNALRAAYYKADDDVGC